MTLHLLYIIAFTMLAVLAIANLIRNLISLGLDSQRTQNRQSTKISRFPHATPPHPEFLDERGKLINEPLLVMRSMTIDDARQHLDALYESSPGSSNLNTESREES